MKMLRVLVWSPWVLVSCAGGGVRSADLDTGAAGAGGGALDTGGEDGDLGREGSWWMFDADLVVVDGVVEPVGSTVSLSLRVDDAVECTDTLPVDAVVAGKAPHAAVYAWWTLAWDPAKLTCMGGAGFDLGGIELGIGLLDPEIRALVGRLDDVSDAAAVDTLNGAYATLAGDDRLLVFGAAGRAPAWSGEGSAASSAPLPDGTWKVRAVYSFEL